MIQNFAEYIFVVFSYLLYTLSVWGKFLLGKFTEVTSIFGLIKSLVSNTSCVKYSFKYVTQKCNLVVFSWEFVGVHAEHKTRKFLNEMEYVLWKNLEKSKLRISEFNDRTIFVPLWEGTGHSVLNGPLTETEPFIPTPVGRSQIKVPETNWSELWTRNYYGALKGTFNVQLDTSPKNNFYETNRIRLLYSPISYVTFWMINRRGEVPVFTTTPETKSCVWWM